MELEKVWYGDACIIAEKDLTADPVTKDVITEKVLAELKKKITKVLDGKEAHGWERVVKKRKEPIYKQDVCYHTYGDGMKIVGWEDVVYVGLRCFVLVETERQVTA